MQFVGWGLDESSDAAPFPRGISAFKEDDNTPSGQLNRSLELNQLNLEFLQLLFVFKLHKGFPDVHVFCAQQRHKSVFENSLLQAL